MRKLIVSEFATLDGVMQAPGGKDEDRDGGFEHGGWTLPYWHDDIGNSFGSLMRDVEAPWRALAGGNLKLTLSWMQSASCGTFAGRRNQTG
jgi:hypothetical protein